MRRPPPDRPFPWGRMPLVAVALLAGIAAVYWPSSLDADLPPPLRIEEMAALDDAALVERVGSDLRWRMARLDADPCGWRGAPAPVRNLFALAIGGRMLGQLGLRACLEQAAADPEAPSPADIEAAAREIPLPALAAALAPVRKLPSQGQLAPAACAAVDTAVRQALAAPATGKALADYIRANAAGIYPAR